MAGARRSSWVWIVFLVVITAVVIAPATFAAVRLTAPPPAAAVSLRVPAGVLLDGTGPPPIPTPSNGSFALATSMTGSIVALNAAAVRPIGSVAKAMTALVVLDAHPLDPGASGPSITMTASDVLLYRKALAEGGSNLRVRAGEVLTERDLLLALLLPSADNIAETLAVWVSGNRSAFIARLNATAAEMGMAHTHFADPSGLSVRTVSTAGDLVALAKAVIADRALEGLVGTAHAALPDGTVLNNLDILLNRQAGWLGIKTGWTGAAGGCLLFADQMRYDTGDMLTVWGAVLGQPPAAAGDPAHPELGQAFASAQHAVIAAVGAYAAVDLAAFAPQVSGSVTTRWGDSALVTLSPAESKKAFIHAGAALHFHVTDLAPRAPIAPGTAIGLVTGVVDAKTSITWTVVSASAIAAPSLSWRLFSA
ncbi:MAG: D-alanyl-D-alanine carboxypeptidase family protein [Candidatus Dormibacteria bacterium]